MNFLKYILIFLFTLLLNRTVSATEIDVVVNQNVFFGVSDNQAILKANGWATKQIAETNLKNLWKNAFIANAEDLFKPISQGGLGVAKMKQLFESNNFTFNNSNQFKNLLNNNTQFRNNVLKFIKVE